jgi:predicted amidohydrolase YtcJ
MTTSTGDHRMARSRHSGVPYIGVGSLVVVSARVWTGDPDTPWAEALAVRGDTITAVGTTEAIRAKAGPGTRVIDAAGGMVTPGFIDSMQPYHAIDDGRWAERVIGPVRAEGTHAFRSLLDAGAMLAFGSDWFVASPTPLEGIAGAVTHHTLDGVHPVGGRVVCDARQP